MSGLRPKMKQAMDKRQDMKKAFLFHRLNESRKLGRTARSPQEMESLRIC